MSEATKVIDPTAFLTPFFRPILWALILVRLFDPLFQYLTCLLRGIS